jgi:hypothetical protein
LTRSLESISKGRPAERTVSGGALRSIDLDYKDGLDWTETQTEARTIAMIPARIAYGRVGQADTTSASSGDKFAAS